MNEKLTLGSLFDGIGGFLLAGVQAGIQPVWASEIEPFPIRVTTKRFPEVRHVGDIHALHGGDIEPAHIITFGSPCQNLSIAGNRVGLSGDQSSLFFEAIRIIREMREKTHDRYPRWCVWENVPGALSSCNGGDFQKVLESLIQIKDPKATVPMPDGKWLSAGEIRGRASTMGDDYSLAWRVIDAAKGWGVAQRRRRIFAVLDLDGGCAGQILFESEGLSGYTPPSAEARQGTAGNSADGTGTAGNIVLNDQGGQRMDVSEEVTHTLRAAANSHQPCVVEVAGFCTEHSANSRGIGYEEERSPTLRAGTVPGIAIEYQPSDSRIKMKDGGSSQTLCSRMGTGGNQVPLTLKICSGCEGSGNGALIQENVSGTLSCHNGQSPLAPKVYGISSDQSNAMLSDNPHSGIYEADTSRTLDTSGGNPACNQGGIAVVEAYVPHGSMNGSEDKSDPQGDGVNKEGSFTLNNSDRHAAYAMTTGSFTQVDEEVAPPIMARDYKDPPVVGYGSNACYAIDRAAYNQGANALFDISIEKERAQSLVARGPGAVAHYETHDAQPVYVIRRLTPGECCRLQGYPDGWCEGLETESPTEEDISYWTQVFSAWDKATGHEKRVRKRTQIEKWLKNPHSDSAEYKAYGNSVAVPCVFFVLAGIVWSHEQEGAN